MKKRLRTLVGTTLMTGVLAASTAAASAQQFTSTQKQQIEAIIKNYIIKNPEILVEAGKTLQKQQMEKVLSHAQIAAVEQADKLVNDTTSPAIGKTSASVTVIEFYDYQCSVCHHQAPIMEKLIKKHPNARFIFRQLPIFGPASQYASQIATMDAYPQGKFATYNKKLFATGLMEGQLTKKVVNDIAKSSGVRIKADSSADEKAAQQYFKQSIALARALGFPGTPGIIVMPNSASPDSSKVTVFLGYSSLQTLDKAIDKAK